MNPTPRPAAASSLPLQALLATRPFMVRAAWLSLVIGLLMLVPSWYMFEVYGRVLDSRNATTLAWMLAMTIGIYIALELLDLVRSRLLHQASASVEARLRKPLFDAVFEASQRRAPGGTPQAFADLRNFADALSTPAVTAVLDLPSAFVMLALLAMLSPWLGLLAAVGIVLQGVLALVTERRTMPLLAQASVSSIGAQNYATGVLRNAQVIEAMGMLGGIHGRWLARQRRFIAAQSQASDQAGLTSMGARLVQTMQGSLLMGVACWLLIENDLWGGGGMLIVASILGGRALQPLAQLVAQWRVVVNARDAYTRLDALLAGYEEPKPAMPLPAPKGQLTVENIVAAAPGGQFPILRGVAFAARPGEVVAVVGPSASGKTTLARLLVGIWPASAGKVRLDGVDVATWNKNELGPHVGYLPQDVHLLDGTIGENIARFDRVDPDKVRAAAHQVGALEWIESLPEGFDTRIGSDGAILSGGQRQRLGLARAVYRDPPFLVLDEPNASLDEAGEKDLVALLQALKARGATTVVITHRMGVLAAVDRLLVLADGQSKLFGPRDEVLDSLAKANEQARAQAQRAVTSAGAPA